MKEGLVARAEELTTSEDWKQTAIDMRELMTQWKSAGRASREVEDALWTALPRRSGRVLRPAHVAVRLP